MWKRSRLLRVTLLGLGLLLGLVLLRSLTSVPQRETQQETASTSTDGGDGSLPPTTSKIPTEAAAPTNTPPDNYVPFQKADVYATAEQLMIDRQTGGAAAAEKYVGKVIAVQGVVDTASSTEKYPSLSFKVAGLCPIPQGNTVNCFWMDERERNAVAKLHPGDNVTVLGRFAESGRYDMPKEYDIPSCAYYVNLRSCTVTSPTQAPSSSANTDVPQSAPVDVSSLRKAAEQGDTETENSLGLMFENGQGVSQDYTQAIYWWRRAAEQGNVKAQYNLGISYERGKGVTKDDSQAVYWYRKAADQGLSDAQYNLGVFYEKGRAVSQDYAQAFYWYSKAAEQGSAVAQDNLAVLYESGQGVPQDYTLAYFWLDLAASGKIDGVMPEELDAWRDEAASHLTPQELSKARERVRQWSEGHPPKVQ
jgi:hypothetical protein